MKFSRSTVVVNFRKREVKICKCEVDICNLQHINGQKRGCKESMIQKNKIVEANFRKFGRRTRIPQAAYGKDCCSHKVSEVRLWKLVNLQYAVHKLWKSALRNEACEKSPAEIRSWKTQLRKDWVAETQDCGKVELRKDLVAKGPNCGINIAEGDFDQYSGWLREL